MKSFSGLGIGLSLVFGCLLLALVAELYYVLWWKKRITHRQDIEADYSNHAKELIKLFCWKKPSSLHSTNTHQDREPDHSTNTHQDREPDHPVANAHEPDPELGTSKDLLIKALGDESEVAELMRLHNLAGPPRFLFTIKEETKEDMESDDGKSRGGDRSRKGSRTKSLSDLVVTVDSPFLTPLASSPRKSPLNPLDSYHHRGFNPLFESSGESGLNRLRSSPPPKFKFLRDAEEKLWKRLLMEDAEKRIPKPENSVLQDSGVKALNISTEDTVEGSFLKFIVGQAFNAVSFKHFSGTSIGDFTNNLQTTRQEARSS
ncbi:hypothetical protein Pint_32352 [Pistacia integerrima]|uniref:Uncharacterized protein n=1 Tax=Pistacia integerrima TaxID=434235 RepID=A0ACC0XSH9_9ROSI|nr:hypothetical protein Pint_32352 [Pistacia integerrima]